jgi:hypothetical protein
LPVLAISATGLTEQVGDGSIILPVEVESTGLAGSMGDTALVLHELNLLSGQTGALLSLPWFSVDAAGEAGKLGIDAALTLTAFDVAGTVLSGSVGVGNSILAALQTAGSLDNGTEEEAGCHASSVMLPFMLDASARQTLSEQYRGIVFNLLHQGISDYEGFSFNSLCRFNGAYLAAGSDGLYLLDGDRDNDRPIDVELHTGITDMRTNLLEVYSKVVDRQ